MAKENLVVPLDKLLRRYKKDRQWLSILCRTDYKEMTKMLESKTTTYGDLQQFLLKGGISLKISIQGEIPPYKNGRRTQFMEYNMQLHKGNATYIAERVRSGAPKSWFDDDDIPLVDLVEYEKVIDNSKLIWSFTGLNGVTDYMNTAVIKMKTKGEDTKWISEDCLARFRKAVTDLYSAENRIPEELLTEPVRKDAAEFLMNHIISGMSDEKETDIPATQADETAKTDESQEKPDPMVTMNVTMIEDKMDGTGFSRELAGALVYDMLVKDKLTQEENEAYLSARKRVDAAVDWLNDNYYWLMDILHKKGHKDRDIFSITKTNWCEIAENTPTGESLKYSALADILLKANCGLSLRFMSDPKLEPRYRDLRTGFLQKWINVNDPDHKVFPGSVVKTVFDYDDYWMSDTALRDICKKTGENLSICIFSYDNPLYRPVNEMSAINAPKKAEPEQPKKAKVPAVKKTVRKSATSASLRPDVGSWLKSQEEYGALCDRLGSAAAILDGRYGDDTINAALRFDAEGNLGFALLSRRLMQAVRSGAVDARPGAEPDFDRQILITDNRRFINRLQCIDEILATLRKCFGHTVVTFSAPVTTKTGKTAISLSLNLDDGLNIQTEDKGFFKKKEGTFTAEDPHQLADLFATEDWYDITRAVKAHYDVYGLAELRRRVQGTLDTCRQSETAYETALRGVRNSTVALVAETQDTGFLSDFSEIIGDALFSSPSIEDGHAWFHRTMDSAEDRVNDEQLPVDTLMELNRLLTETIRKKLYPKNQ